MGDFALALWDREQRVLIAATDPFGVYPIFYATSPNNIAVATTTPELWTLPLVGDELDTDAIVGFLIDVPPAPDTTYYRHIKRLPGGHVLIARRGHFEIWRFWGPNFPADPAVSTPEAYLEKFRELFFDAVASRLASREPTGILMSGGFDSTSVAAVAAALLLKQPDAYPSTRTYSAVFGDLACDETPRIRLVQNSLPFPCRNISPEDRALTIQEIGDDVALHDEPQVALQRIIFEKYFEACRADGTLVLLGGLAGDELAVDWQYHVDLLRRRRWTGLASTLSDIARIEQIPFRSGVAMALRGSLPPWLRRSHLRARLRSRPSDRVRSMLEPEHWPVAARLAHLRLAEPVGYDSHSNEVRWQAINDTRAQRAHAWWNREFDAAGLRLAAPFRDRRLFELVLGTPSRLHPRTFDRGEYKPLITRGLGSLLPPEITSSYWKVEFNAYEWRVLAASHASLSDYLFGGGVWRSSAFVSKTRARRLWEICERCLTRSEPDSTVISTAVRMLGLETWLRHRMPGNRGAMTHG